MKIEADTPDVRLERLIESASAARGEAPRPHLGASQIGHHCDRWLWLSFRWAVVEEFQGRTLRIFRRGKHEEAWVYDDLRAAGITVEQTQGRVWFSAHLSGSIDGEILGVPGAEKTRHLLEIKTHSRKSFEDVQKHGVRKSKPMHWAQMQVYMLGRKLDRAIYYAICKDDDRIYIERLELDRAAAESYVSRGLRLTTDERMPAPISVDPSWYQCKWCAAHSFCHETRLTKEVNCRTCAHSTPGEQGWRCELWDSPIPEDVQRGGCESHALHPDLVPWRQVESASPKIAAYMTEDGRLLQNGEPDGNVYSSRELIEGTWKDG